MPFHFNYGLGPTVSVRREELVVAEALGQNMGLLVSLLPYHLLVILVRSYPEHACLVLGGGNWDQAKTKHFETHLLSYHLPVASGRYDPNQCQTALSLFAQAP